jgi:SNF2 family DNA or RNA helicase
VLKNYAHILELLLRLRQACNHPYLVLNNKRTTTDISNIVQKYLLETKMGNYLVSEQLKEMMNGMFDSINSISLFNTLTFFFLFRLV